MKLTLTTQNDFTHNVEKAEKWGKAKPALISRSKKLKYGGTSSELQSKGSN